MRWKNLLIPQISELMQQQPKSFIELEIRSKLRIIVIGPKSRRTLEGQNIDLKTSSRGVLVVVLKVHRF